MNDFAALSRMIENLIRLGTIAAVDHAAQRVRVLTGDLLTGWLPGHRRGPAPTGNGTPPP